MVVLEITPALYAVVVLLTVVFVETSLTSQELQKHRQDAWYHVAGRYTPCGKSCSSSVRLRNDPPARARSHNGYHSADSSGAWDSARNAERDPSRRGSLDYTHGKYCDDRNWLRAPLNPRRPRSPSRNADNTAYCLSLTRVSVALLFAIRVGHAE